MNLHSFYVDSTLIIYELVVIDNATPVMHIPKYTVSKGSLTCRKAGTCRRLAALGVAMTVFVVWGAASSTWNAYSKHWWKHGPMFSLSSPSFGICTSPMSKSKVYIPNAPPFLCAWDQSPNHLRGLLSSVAHCSSLSASPRPQSRGTSRDCLPNGCAHTPSRAPEKVLFCVQFPVPYRRQLIFPLLFLRVLFIKAAASVVLWCAVWLPCVCSAWLPHLSLLSLHTGTSSITASLEHSQNLVCAAALAQSHVNTPQQVPLSWGCYFFSWKCDFFYLVPNQESGVENQTSKFNWLCLMEGILICSPWPFSIINGNKDLFCFIFAANGKRQILRF